MGDPIKPSSVQINGRYTNPRSFGVYELPEYCGATRRYRFGNHPVRKQELEREFGNCTLKHLFLDREDARKRALWLNDHEA